MQIHIKMLPLLLCAVALFACQGQENNTAAIASPDAKCTGSANQNARLVSNKSDFSAIPGLYINEGKPSALTTEIIFQSVDGGASWSDVSAGLPQDFKVSRTMIDGGKIFLVAERGMYSSQATKQVPVWENQPLDLAVSNIFPGQTGTYLSNYGKGLFKKIPGTDILVSLNNNLKDKQVRTMLETTDGSVLVGCETGIYKSTDGGKNWKQVFEQFGVNSFVEAEGVLISGTYGGLLRSTDQGEHWDWVLSNEGSAYRTGYFEGRFVSITQGGKWQDDPDNRLHVSSDGGKTWQRLDEHLIFEAPQYINGVNGGSIHMINDIKMAGKYLFCSNNLGVFRSADWGEHWEPVFGSSDKMNIELAVSGGVVYIIQVTGC